MKIEKTKMKILNNTSKYINDRYIKDGKAIINIYISEENQLYDPLDKNKLTLDQNIIGYIDRQAYNIPIYREIVIEIESKEDIDLTKVEELIKTHYGMIIHDKKIDIRINTLKVIWLFIIGMIFFTLSVASVKWFNSFLIQLFTTIGTFSMWEITNVMLLGNRKIKVEQLNALHLYNSEIALKENNI